MSYEPEYRSSGRVDFVVIPDKSEIHAHICPTDSTDAHLTGVEALLLAAMIERLLSMSPSTTQLTLEDDALIVLAVYKDRRISLHIFRGDYDGGQHIFTPREAAAFSRAL